MVEKVSLEKTHSKEVRRLFDRCRKLSEDVDGFLDTDKVAAYTEIDMDSGEAIAVVEVDRVEAEFPLSEGMDWDSGASLRPGDVVVRYDEGDSDRVACHTGPTVLLVYDTHTRELDAGDREIAHYYSISGVFNDTMHPAVHLAGDHGIGVERVFRGL